MKLTDFLERLEELEKLATKGRWFFNGYSAVGTSINDDDNLFSHHDVIAGDTGTKQATADCAFVAESRNALPLLLKIIRRQNEVLESVSSLGCRGGVMHTEIDYWTLRIKEDPNNVAATMAADTVMCRAAISDIQTILENVE